MKITPANSTIGILGGGQLAKMLAEKALEMGYQVHVYCPEAECPASFVDNIKLTTAPYEQRESLEQFADAIDILTFEFENIPLEPLSWITDKVAMSPSLALFRTLQNRIAEKDFLSTNNISCSPFAVIRQTNDIEKALIQVTLPAVLKTSQGGYDGKGQSIVHSKEDLLQSFKKFGGQACTLEQWVDLHLEVSVLIARNQDGKTSAFGPIENHHKNAILDQSSVPSSLDKATEANAIAITTTIAHKLELVGLICVEFFITKDLEVLVNEIAPRTHNSGHLTIEASDTSQFEQQIRAICSLELGNFNLKYPAKMQNLLGDLWKDKEPNWEELTITPNTFLHLYGKKEPRPGRKMGHLTTLIMK